MAEPVGYRRLYNTVHGFACRVTTATATSVVRNTLLSYCNNGYSNTFHCYVIRTLNVLFYVRPKTASQLTQNIRAGITIHNEGNEI